MSPALAYGRFIYDVGEDSESISRWLNNEEIILTQNEFDALVTHRYNTGGLQRYEPDVPDWADYSVLELLSAKNRNREDYESVFEARRSGPYSEALSTRTAWELDIFFDNDYNKDGDRWFNTESELYGSALYNQAKQQYEDLQRIDPNYR
jgi:hypothetical protein